MPDPMLRKRPSDVCHYTAFGLASPGVFCEELGTAIDRLRRLTGFDPPAVSMTYGMSLLLQFWVPERIELFTEPGTGCLGILDAASIYLEPKLLNQVRLWTNTNLTGHYASLFVWPKVYDQLSIDGLADSN